MPPRANGTAVGESVMAGSAVSTSLILLIEAAPRWIRVKIQPSIAVGQTSKAKYPVNATN